MFNKYQGVFRSRWKALMWAAGVCLTAYCTVPRDGEDAGAGLLGGAAPQSEARHAPADPWALDKPDPGKNHG
jgi:hypothetical protein